MEDFENVYADVYDSLTDGWAGQMAQKKKTLKASVNSFSVEVENKTGKDLKLGLLIPAGINTLTITMKTIKITIAIFAVIIAALSIYVTVKSF